MSHEDFKFYTIQIVHFLHLTSVHAGCVSVVTCKVGVSTSNQSKEELYHIHVHWVVN